MLNARLQLGFPVEKCALCTLMEEETAPAATDGKSVSLSFHPFEIKSCACGRRGIRR